MFLGFFDMVVTSECFVVFELYVLCGNRVLYVLDKLDYRGL